MNKLTLGIVAAIFSTSVNASWSIVDIGELLGKEKISVSAINDYGQIAGSFFDSNTSLWHAFSTGTNGSNIKDIGSAPNSFVTASHINNNGQVIVQYVSPPEGDNVEFKYFITEFNGNKTELTTFSEINGHPSGINDSGQLIGTYFTPGEVGFTSFISDVNGNYVKDIETFNGSDTSATAINNSGQVVGTFVNLDGRIPREHAFITNSDGSIRDLSDPGEKYYKGSMAYDINNSGQVAGILSTENHRWTQAFITGDDGNGIIELGTVPGAWGGYAVAINDAGQAVGIYTDITGAGVGSFIYANGGLTDLLAMPGVIDAGWTSLFVSDINNNGQIVGTGYLANDPNPHSFLLSFTSDTVFTPYDFYIPPIPEPSTYLMFLAGLGLLGFVGRKGASF